MLVHHVTPERNLVEDADLTNVAVDPRGFPVHMHDMPLHIPVASAFCPANFAPHQWLLDHMDAVHVRLEIILFREALPTNIADEWRRMDNIQMIVILPKVPEGLFTTGTLDLMLR